MNILFLSEDFPITPDGYGGASALLHNHLEFLAHGGHSISLLRLEHSGASLGFAQFVEEQPHIWQQVQGWVRSSRHIVVGQQEHRPPRWQRAMTALRDPVAFKQGVINPTTLAMLRKAIDRVAPDLIWAEHFLPALLVSRLRPAVPVIYSHHDWFWRIKWLRRGQKGRDLFARWYFFRLRRTEEALIRQVTGCISASATEASEIEALGGQCVAYLPTAYPPVALPLLQEPLPAPRVVHLGGMRTTANRLGLERFLDIVWPQVCKQMTTPPELWVVGDLRGISDPLQRQLEQAGAVCTGFAPNLATVLRPYDIHVMPWEYNTGTRTRLPVIFNFAQVLVATSASAACVPEAQHASNALLVDALPDMAATIIALCADSTQRKQLGQAARHTFEQSFVRAALQPRFDRFLEQCQQPTATSPGREAQKISA